MKVLMIIPAYNEEKSILKTIENLKSVNSSVDYVIINDGSSDRTKKICEDNNLNYIDLINNLGIGGAVQTGYMYAFQNNYDIAIQFDGDGQHDAKYISDLIDAISKGNDMVIGSRFIEKTEGFKSSFMRRQGIQVLSTLIKICTGKKITDPTSGFRAANRKVIEYFMREYPVDYPEPDTIVKLLKRGYKVKEIPVLMKERKNGKSSITPLKSIYYMIKVCLSIIMASLSSKGEN